MITISTIVIKFSRENSYNLNSEPLSVVSIAA